MKIERTPPPGRKPRRGRYSDLFAALAVAPGEWLAVPVEEIGGRTDTKKQVNLHQAAWLRGLRINTAVRADRMFIRLRTETA